MWDQLNFFIRKVGDQQIRGVISFNGKIDEQIMKKAVRFSLGAEPVLSCRYVENYLYPLWERVPAAEDQEFCELLTTMDADEEISHFLVQAIDPFKSPQVKVLIVRHQTDTLCINMNHAAGDAAGLKDYLYLLSSIYRGLMADPDYEPAPNVKGSRSLWQVGKHLTFFQKARIARQSMTRPRPVSDWRLPLRQADNEDKFILTRRLPPERFRSIREYARQYSGTINDLILAAYFRALYRIIQPDLSMPLRAFVTVDLRRYIPSESAAAICNLSSSVFPNIGNDLGTNLGETMIRVVKKMNELKGAMPGLTIFAMLTIPFKVLPYGSLKQLVHGLMESAGGASAPGFTNMGIIDSGRLVFPGVNVKDAFITGAVNYPPAFQLGFSSFKESLTFSVCSCGNETNRPLALSVLDLLEEELPD
jgi:NRPS condensation-like uncharacterized protein